MTSTELGTCEKLFSEKLQAYLFENPIAYDVTFSVGPTKERVSAVKLVLVASSPVFRKLFEENWDMAVVRNNEGIALPDIDACAFKIFLQLLPSEHISIDAFQKLNLSADQIFSLVSISKQFGMSTMQTVFEKMSQPFFKHFDTYAGTKEFLKLSSKNLATILASDQVLLKEIDIFKLACRWAHHQLSNLDASFEQTSMREVLGESLKEIRFPLMTCREFGRKVCPSDVLLPEEKLKIFEFISLADHERNDCDKSLLGFKTAPRIKASHPPKSGKSTESPRINQRLELRLFENSELVSTPSIVCDRSHFSLAFDLDKKIELLGIGFAGPANSSGEYDVMVVLSILINGNFRSFRSTERTVQAKHSEKFYIFFDNPIICNPGTNNTEFFYNIDYFVKGPEMQSVDLSKYKNEKGTVKLTKIQDGVTFDFEMDHSHIVKLLFRKYQ